MSTKTLRKRIALVAVAALGFGMLSTGVASAATYTAGITLSTTSLTVDGGLATSSGAGRFYVDTVDDAGDAAGLFSTESISVTVTGKPTRADGVSTANSDLTLSSVVVTNKTSVATAGSATATTVQIPQGGTAANYVSSNNTYVSATTTSTNARYWFAVYPNTANAVDAGAYTLSVKLKDSTGFITTKTLSVKFVTNLASTDATLTVSQVGTLVKGQALTYTSANNIKVVLADANGGKVQSGAALNASLISNAPTLSAAITTSAGVVSETLDGIADSGIAATDHVASSTSAIATNQVQSATADGTYGVTDSAIGADASTTSLLRIRISNSGVEKTAALTVYAATTAVDAYTDLTLTATGVLAADQLIKSNVDTTTAFTIPTTTTSAKLRINIDGTDGANLPDAAITTSVVWSGNYSSVGTYYSPRWRRADIEVPNLPVDVSSWGRSACYP